MTKALVNKIKSNKVLYTLCLPFAKAYEWLLWLPVGIGRVVDLCVLPSVRAVFCRNRKGYDICKYKDREKGKRIFIISSGPSLTMEDIDKIKDEVTIGVNGVISLYEKIGWQPKYYVVSDKIVLDGYYNEINNAKPENAIFCRNKNNEKKWAFTPTYCSGYVNLPLAFCRHRPNSKLTKKYMSFEDNLEKKGVFTGGRSVATYAMQIAAYLGAAEIVLLGQDCDYGGKKKYFNDKAITNVNEDSTRTFIETMFDFYEYARKHLEKKGVRIYNATRGGKLEVFERVDLDELVKR